MSGSPIRLSRRLQDDIDRFQSIHNTYEERAYGKILTLAPLARQLADENVAMSVERMQRLSFPITVEKSLVKTPMRCFWKIAMSRMHGRTRTGNMCSTLTSEGLIISMPRSTR